jgi:holo-[acyl-carrier protein] synthase
MVYGIGTDIVENGRIKAAVEKWGERFLERVFSDSEISFCMSRQDPYPSLAARFAAKEAFIKAFSPFNAVSLRDIEVISDQAGKPFLKLHGMTDRASKEKKISGMHVSLSHEHDYSVAFVLLERTI